jgi:hypothetical protein
MIHIYRSLESTCQGTAFSLAPDHNSPRLCQRGECAAAGADLAHIDQVAADLDGKSPQEANSGL